MAFSRQESGRWMAVISCKNFLAEGDLKDFCFQVGAVVSTPSLIRRYKSSFSGLAESMGYITVALEEGLRSGNCSLATNFFEWHSNDAL
ncbi:hypothetical protein CEXT_618861 [Caerostris extrusa]|uniref:Uncharacterized protein n=1 Tax=Caerostris extrusa TaxID=172846 RepID=A0AAV4MJS0_CAEEX|nr:hypothetical protein CEXT_618861 [Caerostris extrusa]